MWHITKKNQTKFPAVSTPVLTRINSRVLNSHKFSRENTRVSRENTRVSRENTRVSRENMWENMRAVSMRVGVAGTVHLNEGALCAFEGAQCIFESTLLTFLNKGFIFISGWRYNPAYSMFQRLMTHPPPNATSINKTNAGLDASVMRPFYKLVQMVCQQKLCPFIIVQVHICYFCISKLRI